MTSGLETLASIDQAVSQVRRDIQDLDREIQAASDSLVRIGQEETTRFRELADLRLDAMSNGELLTELDQADRRVAELLQGRGEALDSLQAQIEASHGRQSDLESQRAAQQQRVHAASETLDRGEAATQKRLAGVPAYQEQLDKAQKADGVAKQAEEKAQLSEKDRAEKGKAFEADLLFTYLWKRGYGTSRYSANPLFRFLDGWVARLCRYHDARPNYTMLLEIPKRLREHADNVRADADREFAALRELEEKAAAEDGVPALREALAQETRRAEEIDAEIEKEEAHYSELVKGRSEFAGGEDSYSRECLDVLVDQFRREPLAQLRREAEQTITFEDNVAVAKLADLQVAKQRLDAQLAQNKELHMRHLNRLEELEKVRRDFKRQRYDGAHSTFSNGALIGAMLNEFLRGMASSGQAALEYDRAAASPPHRGRFHVRQRRLRHTARRGLEFPDPDAPQRWGHLDRRRRGFVRRWPGRRRISHGGRLLRVVSKSAGHGDNRTRVTPSFDGLARVLASNALIRLDL